MDNFGLDYFLFVFVAALGVLQMAAAYSSLNGLLYIRPRALAFLLGLAVTVGAFVWFFVSEPRNIPDSAGGLDGNQSAGLFALGMLFALLWTLVMSSIVNRSMSRIAQPGSGLDALKDTTYLGALRTTLKRLWSRS